MTEGTSISGKSVVITSAQDSKRMNIWFASMTTKADSISKAVYLLPVRCRKRRYFFYSYDWKTIKRRVWRRRAGSCACPTALIRKNQSHLDEYKGILVERYWELLDEEQLAVQDMQSGICFVKLYGQTGNYEMSQWKALAAEKQNRGTECLEMGVWREISDGRLYGLNDMAKSAAMTVRAVRPVAGMGNTIVLDPRDVWRLTGGLGVSLQQLRSVGIWELECGGFGIILPNLKLAGAILQAVGTFE